eukprot:3351009-Alexandrium_andersonii.AAC.1
MADAYHQAPLFPDEYRSTAAVLGGARCYFRVLVVGAAPAPMLWGSSVACLGRSTAVVTGPRAFGLPIFVDDPLR